ncbi:hypothetical protein Tco_0568568 [Tanacetum coccineum]
MFRFEPLFQEGQCYSISNFPIAKNSGRLPLLPHKYKISFYKGTVVTRIDASDNNVNGFILEPFNRLLDDTRQYHEHKDVDIIGSVVAIGDIVPVQSGVGRKIRRTIVIEDSENRIALSTQRFTRYTKKMGGHTPPVRSVTRKSMLLKVKLCHLLAKVKLPSIVKTMVLFSLHLGYTAWELMEKHDMDVDEYWPEELLDLVGKRFLFKLYYLDYNVNNNNHTYRCDALNDDPAFVKHFKECFLDEEDDDEGFTTPASQIKVTNFGDPSLSRVLDMQTPTIGNEASGSGESSGSKRVFIDLDDVDSEEYEEGIANKTPKLVTVKVEKEDP